MVSKKFEEISFEGLEPPEELGLLVLDEDAEMLSVAIDEPDKQIDAELLASLNGFIVAGAWDFRNRNVSTRYRQHYAITKRARLDFYDTLGWTQTSHIMCEPLRKTYNWGRGLYPKPHNVVELLRQVHHYTGEFMPYVFNKTPQLLQMAPESLRSKINAIDPTRNDASTLLLLRSRVFTGETQQNLHEVTAGYPDLTLERIDLIGRLTAHHAIVIERQPDDIEVAMEVKLDNTPATTKATIEQLAAYTELDVLTLMRITEGRIVEADSNALIELVTEAKQMYEDGDEIMSLRQIGLRFR